MNVHKPDYVKIARLERELGLQTEEQRAADFEAEWARQEEAYYKALAERHQQAREAVFKARTPEERAQAHAFFAETYAQYQAEVPEQYRRYNI